MESELERTDSLGLGAEAALVWLCSVAPLAAILMPLLLPVLQIAHTLNTAQLGLLASADLAGACLSTVTAPLWLGSVGARVGAIAGLVTIVAANMIGAFALAPVALLTTRLVAGLGTGLVLSSSIPVVGRSARPAGLVSAIQVLQLLLAALTLTVAGELLRLGGVRWVLFAVVAVTVLSTPLVLLLPGRVPPTTQAARSGGDLLPAAPILVGILLYFASVMALTNYAGQLGSQHGLPIATLSSALAIANLGALPGSLLAITVRRADRRRQVLIGSSVVQCTAVGVMLWFHAPLAFESAFFVIQTCITIIAPLQIAVLVERDRGGHAIKGLAAMQSIGQAVGPLLGALFITAADVSGAYVFGGAVVLVSLVLVLVPERG